MRFWGLTVIGLVDLAGLRLHGPQQRHDVRPLLPPFAGLCLLAVNLELCAGLEDAHVPVLDHTAHQVALRPSVRWVTHQGQVTVRLTAACRPAALRVRHFHALAQVVCSSFQGGRVETLIRISEFIPVASQNQTTTDQVTDRHYARCEAVLVHLPLNWVSKWIRM